MRTIKFRYICRHKESGNIEVKHYSLSQIEERPLEDLSPVFRYGDYEILSIDEYSGLRDKNGEEIYEGDEVKWWVYDGMTHFAGRGPVYVENGAFRLNEIHPLVDYINNGSVELAGSASQNYERQGEKLDGN